MNLPTAALRDIAFVIDPRDNVATALHAVTAGAVVTLRGAAEGVVTANDDLPEGHKVALTDIAHSASVVKYGEVIGRATARITRGDWVHLHVMESRYDERSSHLDVETGAPLDTKYV